MKAALAALGDARRYASKLEATARAQNTEEQKLLTELGKLRDGLLDFQRELAAEREDSAKTKERLGKVEDENSAKAKESYRLRRQIERLLRRLQRTESQARKKEAELDRVRVDLAEARRRHERQTAEEQQKLREAQTQLRELTRLRDALEKQIQTLASQVEKHHSHEDLARRRDELIQLIRELTVQAEALQRQVEQAEQELKHHEEELERQRRNPPTDPDEPRKPRSLVELLQRRMEEEQARRIAAEQRIAQLLSEIENPDKARQPKADPPSAPPPVAPGQYNQHAVAAGYDFTRDPLLALMRREVVVSDRLADWQAKQNLRRAARRRDVEQTLDEQAYAAAMAARWRLIDHPHLRLGARPIWSLLGCLLDEKSEKYLLTITQERIDEMVSSTGQQG